MIPADETNLAGHEAFAPERAITILEPEHPGPGYWTGCPSVLYEPGRDRFLMTYRQRRPRGVGVERGWRCAIAESSDGVAFHDIWAVEKEELETSSMERFALIHHGGRYLLYISYVDPTDNRWRIDVVESSDPHDFDIGSATAAMTAASTGTEGVKDPHPVIAGSGVTVFASYAAPGAISDRNREHAHANGDVYTTGMTHFPTGLGVSQDGLTFEWQAEVLPVGRGWDSYQSRLATVARSRDGFLGLYDGSANVGENYEERTGLAISPDLRTWTRLTPHRPGLVSPHATGSLRYADIVPVGDEWFVYFESARPDGAHELRLLRLSRETGCQLFGSAQIPEVRA